MEKIKLKKTAIESPVVDLCAIVAGCATKLEIPYLVVGTSARDMILHYGYKAPDTRKKDAKDIVYLLTTYENVPTISDQLYRESILMERV